MEETDKSTIEIIIPNQGLTVTEVVIAKWYKNIGDIVKKGETLLDFESDKAVMELESPTDGKLSKIIAEEEETVPIGGLVAIITV